MGGFNQGFERPSIEDIELGMRITDAGYSIGSVPRIQVQHTKRWTLKKLIYTDVLLRGIPWTRLMLQRGMIPNDLNVSRSQRACVFIAGLTVAAFLVLAYFHPLLICLPLLVGGLLVLTDHATAWRATRQIALWSGAMLLLTLVTSCLVFQPLSALIFLGAMTIVVISHESLRFLMQLMGLPFAILCVPLHFTYFLYSGFAFAAGSMLHLLGVPIFKTSPKSEQEAGYLPPS